MARKLVSTAALYAILDREFHKVRPPGCERCNTPLPFYRDRPDDVSANWDIGTPDACAQNCRHILSELVTRLWAEYELLVAQGTLKL